MDLPTKRKNSKRKPVLKPNKKHKPTLISKSSESCLKLKHLSKNLWNEILKFIDSKAFFTIFPQLNSYFYFLTKDYAIFRTSLQFILKTSCQHINETSYIAIQKNHKGMENILQCQHLEKLDLKIEWEFVKNYDNFDLKPCLDDFFIPMPALKTLKVLKIRKIIYIFEHVCKLIAYMENLEVLKINFAKKFSSESSSSSCTIQKLLNILESSQNCLIKKLSIRYHSSQNFYMKFEKILDSKYINESLEKLSIKNLSYKNTNSEDRFFRTGLNLKVIKLPNTFHFEKKSAQDLCYYLTNSVIIEELQVHDSIMINTKSFCNAIKANKSLKVLALKHFVSFSNYDYNSRFEVSLEDAQELFKTVLDSMIEDFSMIAIANKGSGFYNDIKAKALDQSSIEQKIKKFLRVLGKLLKIPNHIKKINISIGNASYKHIESLADLIIKAVELEKIEYFAGHNLRMLMGKKIETLELKNDTKDFDMHDFNAIFYKILKMVLVGNDRILKIVEHKSEKFFTDIKGLIEYSQKNKSLVLNPKDHPNKFSPLHHFSLLALSTQVRNLTVLNLRYVYLESYITTFSELLEEFVSLEKLKLRILNKNENDLGLSIIIKAVTSYLKNVSYIKCKFKTYCKINTAEIFNDLTNYQALNIFKLKRCILFNKNSETILNNFFLKSRLTVLSLCNAVFTYEIGLQLAKGLQANTTITCLKLENMVYEENSKGYIEEEFMKNRKKILLKILESIKNKKNYEIVSIYYFYRSKQDFYLNWKHEKVKDKSVELYISHIDTLLSNNQNLREFNVCMELPYKFLIRYSEIILGAIRNFKNLKIVNFFDIRAIQKSGEKICKYAKRYHSRSELGRFYSKFMKMDRQNHGFYDSMPLVLSEIAKNYKSFILGSFIKILYGDATVFKCKCLTIENTKEITDEVYRIYKYNFLEAFYYLEELLVYDIQIRPSEIEIFEKIIGDLEHLHTIKLKNNFLNSIKDLSGFLNSKSLRYLKIINNIIVTYQMENLSDRIKSSRLEKLTLKNVKFLEFSDDELCFKELFKAIICPSVKNLKIYMNYTSSYLYFLIEKLNKFTKLEYIGLSITQNYKSFELSIKTLISIVQNHTLKLNKIKISKYIWDIGKIKGEKDLKIVGCKLCPCDLMILTELCEQKVLENVRSVDLSENMDIVDDGFAENIARVIKGLGCSKVVLKNTGCDTKHKREIKRLLKEKRCSLVKVIISF